MHECNAMQLLETREKKKKTQKPKNNGHKGKTMKLNRDILKTHNLSFNKIPNEVIPNIYVFSLRMLNMILKYINSTRVITVNNHGILGYPIIS